MTSQTATCSSTQRRLQLCFVLLLPLLLQRTLLLLPPPFLLLPPLLALLLLLADVLPAGWRLGKLQHLRRQEENKMNSSGTTAMSKHVQVLCVLPSAYQLC
jgi:hypothetical protein